MDFQALALRRTPAFQHSLNDLFIRCFPSTDENYHSWSKRPKDSVPYLFRLPRTNTRGT
jgi:hypothetical protein